jgi:hypothetical protein
MTALLRALRKLVLGETWIVPLGVGAAVGATAIGAALLGSWFDAVGGFALLAGALATLALATRP